MVIDQKTFLSFPSPKAVHQDPISTSDRNERNHPRNAGIPGCEDQVTIYPSWKDGRQEDMIESS